MTEDRLPWSATYDVPEGHALVRQPGFDATWRTLGVGNFTAREIALAWRVTYDVLDAMGIPTGTHERPETRRRGSRTQEGAT